MATAVVQFKRCCTCKESKPATDFPRDRSVEDGLNRRCRVCQNAVSRACYRRLADARRLRNKLYDHSKPGSAVRLAYRKKRKLTERHKELRKLRQQRDKFSGKTAARSVVAIAVRTGRLPRAGDLLCRHCGKQAEQYHHFKGYAPEHHFDIIPLCQPCHRAAEPARPLVGSTASTGSSSSGTSRCRVSGTP